MLCDNNDADKEHLEKTGPQMCQVWDVADEDIDSDFSNFHKHSSSVNVNPLQGLHERVNCIIPWILLFLCLWSLFCVISDRALLNTGTEWNGTEYTGISRNIPERGRMTPEWTRMVPECTGTSRNDGEIKRNGQEWYRNIPERAGMTPQRREKTLV